MHAGIPISDIAPTIEPLQQTQQCNLQQGRDGRDGRDRMPGAQGPAGRDGLNGASIFGPQGPPGPQGERGPPGPRSGGVIYTRWGKSTCPQVPGTTIVYSGTVAGSWWSHTGGGANYLCLPESPEYSTYHPGVQTHSPLYGAEYQLYQTSTGTSHDHNVPCSVCDASIRNRVLMIPARLHCPDSTWTLEYSGYLMTTSHASPHHRTMYECVDSAMESIPGSAPDINGAVFFHVEATCTGIPCPPYDTQKELTCVVCTK